MTWVTELLDRLPIAANLLIRLRSHQRWSSNCYRFATIGDGRIHIEKINGPFLFKGKGSPAEYGAGMKLALERDWLVIHESGTFVRFTLARAECLHEVVLIPGDFAA